MPLFLLCHHSCHIRLVLSCALFLYMKPVSLFIVAVPWLIHGTERNSTFNESKSTEQNNVSLPHWLCHLICRVAWTSLLLVSERTAFPATLLCDLLYTTNSSNDYFITCKWKSRPFKINSLFSNSAECMAVLTWELCTHIISSTV